MNSEPGVIFEPLASHHDRTSFSCGELALDDYLRERAGQDVRRKIARVIVAVDRTNGLLTGYYTLSAASFFREDLPEGLAKRLPHYPVPAAILGRLAVDRRYQGRGLGALMLADAIKRLVRASESLAIYALIADAKNDGAKAFYEHFGFQAFPDASMRLFMPLGRFIKS